MSWRVVGGCAVLGVLVFLAGCSPDNPWGRKAVTGTLTWNGEPVKEGSVSLMPLSDPTTVGGGLVIDGKFSIETERGLKPGDYAVTLNIPDPNWTLEKSSRPKEAAPLEWRNGKDHTITITENGPNHFDFAVVNNEPIVYSEADKQISAPGAVQGKKKK